MYQVREVRYDNGLRLLIAENPASREVSFRMYLPYGDAHCQYDTRETAHFLEHMFFRSTGKKRYADLMRELDRMTVEVDAGTKMDKIGIDCSIPPQHLLPTLRILLNCFENRTFDPEELETERRVITGDLRIRRGETRFILMTLCIDKSSKITH